jgi:hypothetical protein
MTDKEIKIQLARKFLEEFFQFPNQFSLKTDLNPPELSKTILKLQPSFRNFELGNEERPLLLPFRQDGEACTVWYACASSESQLRALESELMAFIGPTYANFRMPRDGVFNADLNVLPKIRDLGWRCFVLWTESLEDDSKLLRKWQMYWDLLDQQPTLVARIPKSFDALRLDFDRSLLTQDESTARIAFAAMKDRYGISAENRLYLEIRLFAGLEQWHKIASHHLLPTIVNLNLPLETYGDVLEGLYMSEIFQYEQTGTLEAAIQEFKVSVVENALVLFRTRRQSRRVSVIKSFVLFELTQTHPQVDFLSQLLQQLPQGAFGVFDADVRKTLDKLRERNVPSNAAWDAYEYEQFDRAFELLWPLPDSAEILRALIRCVDESEDPEKAKKLIQRLEKVSEDVHDEILLRCPKSLPRVLLLSQICTESKLTWFEKMTWQQEAGETLDGYIDRWREWTKSIDVLTLLSEKDFGLSAAQFLESLAIEHVHAFQRVVILWHELFIINSNPMAHFKPIYFALLETLRLPGTYGDVELKLIRDVLSQLVRSGLTSEEYIKSINQIILIFEQVRSPHHMNWGLDICDTLAIAPCPHPDSRLKLLASLINAGTEFAPRLNETDKAMLKILSAEAGMEWKNPVGLSSDILVKPFIPSSVGVVGIYSLDEAASQRAAKVLLSIYDGLEVRTNHDEVCTNQLKSLAQRASIFVFAWKTSKHAAYYCIKAAVNSDNALVMAQGAGTSSMVEATIRSIKANSA